jgi:D-galactarolactone cycloisomerase
VKITRIEPILLAIPYEHGAPKSVMGTGTVRTTMDALYLRVETDQGVVGWGEAFGFAGCPVTHAAVERAVSPLAVGREIGDVAGLMHDLHRRLQNMGRNGPVGFALSGLDIALWDIAGQVAGEPIHRLLGSSGKKTRVPAYASLLRIGTPEHVARVAAAAVGRGYRSVKLHERTGEAVAAAREAVGQDIALMLDTNCTWTPDEAVAMARGLRGYGLTWLEEPVFPPDDYAALARVRREGGIAVAAGENLGNLQEVMRIIAAGAIDIVQPDPIKMGGITECWKALEFAADLGVGAEPHSPYYGPGLAASLHLIAAMPGEAMCEFYYADLAASPLGEMIYPQDGFLGIPDAPGLGISVDEDIVARYRVR